MFSDVLVRSANVPFIIEITVYSGRRRGTFAEQCEGGTKCPPFWHLHSRSVSLPLLDPPVPETGEVRKRLSITPLFINRFY